PDFDAAGPEASPEPPRRLAESPHPVIYEPHGNTLACLCEQCAGEFAPNLVLVNDVTLKMHVALRLPNRIEPCRIVLAGVLEEPHAIPGHGRGAGISRESLISDCAPLRHQNALISIRLSHGSHRPSSFSLRRRDG